MSSHQLAIAKASFSAGLLRPDPISIPRDEIAHFQGLLNSLIMECSPANIQNAKRWILQSIIQSPARCLALGKYLTALSISFIPGGPSTSKPLRRDPSAKRKRIHLLFLLHDLLHHAKYHIHDASVASKMQPSVEGLFRAAAAFSRSPKQWKKVQGLLDTWEERDYYPRVYIDRLREVVKNAPESTDSLDASGKVNRDKEATGGTKFLKNTPFTMPAMHGDQGTPWYDLPAGNLLPQIIPNSTRPINPNLVKPLRFTPGPADEALVNAVKDLLRDVNQNFDASKAQPLPEDSLWDIDELGQVVLRDQGTGEVLGGYGYYGWSKGFCEKMKRYGHAYRADGKENSASRSRSRSSSRSHRVKRRRYIDAGVDRGRSRSRSRSVSRARFGQRSYSSSPSPRREIESGHERQSQLQTTRGSTPDSKARYAGSHEAPVLYRSHSASRQSSPDSYEPSHSHEQDAQVLPLSSASHYAHGVIPPPPPYPGQWAAPPMQPYAQHGQAGSAWPLSAPPGGQHWQSHTGGPNPWTPSPQQGGSAYNNHRGGGRGRGRGW